MKNHSRLILLPIITALLLIMVYCKKEESVKQATLSTLSVTDITTNNAQGGGDIASDGGGDITSRGLVWSATPYPTIEQNIGLSMDGTGPGLFQSNITGLQPGTTYYVRAFAANKAGMVYGQQESFTTEGQGGGNGQPGEGVTDIDGNFYPSVVIGNQEWMAANLRVTRDADGNDITRYCYQGDATHCDLYGGLYTWHTVMNGSASSNSNPGNVKGICPTGWHVPSDAEWEELASYVDGQGYPNTNVVNGAGNALKSCRQISSPLGGDCATLEHPRWNAHSIHHGTDEFGFSALPGGARHSNGSFDLLGSDGLWWCATEESSNYPWLWILNSEHGKLIHGTNGKDFGFGLRCLRD